MIFDRISLVSAYKALNYVNANDGMVTDILFNVQSHYGTKTKLRFKNLNALLEHINTNFPYKNIDAKREYVNEIESIWNLLSFSVHLKDIDKQIESKHNIFVNNIRNDFESGSKNRLNSMCVTQLTKLFKGNTRLKFLKDNLPDGGYTVPNVFYTELINKHYSLTQFALPSTPNINPRLISMFRIISRTPTPAYFIHWNGTGGYPGVNSLTSPTSDYYLNDGTATTNLDLVWSDMVANVGNPNNIAEIGTIDDLTSYSTDNIPNGTIGFPSVSGSQRYYWIIAQSVSNLNPVTSHQFTLPDSVNALFVMKERLAFNIDSVPYWMYELDFTSSGDVLNMNTIPIN